MLRGVPLSGEVQDKLLPLKYFFAAFAADGITRFENIFERNGSVYFEKANFLDKLNMKLRQWSVAVFKVIYTGTKLVNIPGGYSATPDRKVNTTKTTKRRARCSLPHIYLLCVGLFRAKVKLFLKDDTECKELNVSTRG